MGGIMCVTPLNAHPLCGRITRLPRILPAAEMGTVNDIEVSDMIAM